MASAAGLVSRSFVNVAVVQSASVMCGLRRVHPQMQIELLEPDVRINRSKINNYFFLKFRCLNY